MKKVLVVILLFILLCFSYGCKKQVEEIAEKTVVDIQYEKAKVQSILNKYIKALTTKDMRLLSEIFAQDEDIVMLDGNTSRRLIGWNNLKERYQEHFTSFEKLGVTFRDLVITIHDSGEVSWLACVFDWTFLTQGKQISTEGLRATWILEKRNDTWKIVQLHFSFPKADVK